jgi:two-component system NarL family sensor kinase
MLARAWGSRLFVQALFAAWALLTLLSIALPGTSGDVAHDLLRLPALGMATRLRLPWSLLGAAVGVQIALPDDASTLSEDLPQLAGIVLAYTLLALIAEGFYAARQAVLRHARERDELAAGLVVASERERRRLAGELHDGPLQSVTAARLQLALSGAGDDADVARCATTLADAASEMRRITSELLPSAMPEGRLSAAIAELAEALRARYGVDVVVDGSPPQLADAQEEEVLPLIREAVTNAAKHGRPPIRVVGVDGGFEVSDSGPGFDPHERPAERFGIMLARARAAAAGARWQIESAPGRPTVVRIAPSAGGEVSPEERRP